MREIMIRVPSVHGLFDEWSAEPLETPLDDDARQRMLDARDEGRLDHQPPDGICLILPAAEQKAGLEQVIATAFHLDMEQMCFGTRHHWIRRSLAARETRIGFLVFVLAMAISVLISSGSDGDSIEAVFAQTFVVIAGLHSGVPPDDSSGAPPTGSSALPSPSSQKPR